MLIANIIHWFADVLFAHGAHHVLTSIQSGNGWMTTKHYLTIVCHIPNTFHHGTFTCRGSVTRP